MSASGQINHAAILQTDFLKNLSSKELLASPLFKVIYTGKIPAQTQGFVGLGHDYIGAFDTSFGNRSSKMTFTSWRLVQSGKQKIFVFKTLKNAKGKPFVLKMPPYLEQVTALNNNRLLAVFESGSSKYRNKTPYIMDRLVSLSYNDKRLYQQVQQQFAKEGIQLPDYHH